MSTTSNEKQEFTITILNRVFDFAAVDAKDAILRLGLVSQQWNDCLNYCPSMWQRLVETEWPAADDDPETKKRQQHYALHGSSVNRYSLGAYRARHITRLHYRRGASEFAEIENCVAADFQFICPILVQNLNTLEGEINPKNGLPMMYCDICELKVHPVTTTEEANECASDQRCVYMPHSLHQAIRQAQDFTPKSITTASSGDSNAPPPPPVPSSLSSNVKTMNVAVIVSPESKNQVEAGAEALRTILRQFADKLSKPDTRKKPSAPLNYMEAAAQGEMNSFLSKNLLKINIPRKRCNYNLIARVIHINKVAPTEAEVEKIAKLSPQDHPAWDGRAPSTNNSGSANGGSDNNKYQDFLSALESNNPLGIMPERGGYQKLLAVDDGAARWFIVPDLRLMIKKSPLFVLSSVARLGDKHFFDGKYGASSLAHQLWEKALQEITDAPTLPNIIPTPVAGGLVAPPRPTQPIITSVTSGLKKKIGNVFSKKRKHAANSSDDDDE